MKSIILLASTVIAMAGASAAVAQSRSEITVGYFLEWPMPFQFAKEYDTYEDKMGVVVNWRSFDTGTAMNAAMASGDVQISVSHGAPPFAIATSAGQDLYMVAVAVAYSENEGCVVHSDLEIDKSNASQLAGKTAVVPVGTAAYYSFLRQMEFLGVDSSTMTVVDMAPAEGAAALSQGSVDVACGWGGAFNRMKESGNVLMTGAEKEEADVLIFDGISVPASFAVEHGDLLANFLSVTEEANIMWKSGEHTAEMLPVIAKDSGMDEASAADAMSRMTFPTIAEQLSPKWFGGGIQNYLAGVAAVFVDAGGIDSALDSYAPTINTQPLQMAEKM